MKPRKKPPIPVEKLFPHATARKHADSVVDGLDVHLDMRAFVDAWEQAYFDVAGKSPFRNGEE